MHPLGGWIPLDQSKKRQERRTEEWQLILTARRLLLYDYATSRRFPSIRTSETQRTNPFVGFKVCCTTVFFRPTWSAQAFACRLLGSCGDHSFLSVYGKYSCATHQPLLRSLVSLPIWRQVQRALTPEKDGPGACF